MNKLFRAGLYRLRKNKGAYACVIIPPIYSVCLMFSQYMQMKESGANYLLDPFLFHFLLVMGVLLSVFVSLYVGTEYHDGTLRNKLISGSSRNAVYGSNLWISFLVGACSVLLAYTAGFAAGIPMFGVIEMPALTMLQTCVAGILLVLSYVSIFHMISMLSSSKTTSAVVCILAAVFMMVFAGIIFSKLSQPEMITQAVIVNGETVMETVKNPAYLTGISRTVYQNILDFLPAGQAVQIFNQGVLNLGRMMGYSILIIFGTSLAGLYLFNRKDIK